MGRLRQSCGQMWPTLEGEISHQLPVCVCPRLSIFFKVPWKGSILCPSFRFTYRGQTRLTNPVISQLNPDLRLRQNSSSKCREKLAATRKGGQRPFSKQGLPLSTMLTQAPHRDPIVSRDPVDMDLPHTWKQCQSFTPGKVGQISQANWTALL